MVRNLKVFPRCTSYKPFLINVSMHKILVTNSTANMLPFTSYSLRLTAYNMTLQTPRIRECLGTVVTLIHPLPPVGRKVAVQLILVGEALVAHLAVILELAQVFIEVHLEVGLVGEGTAAHVAWEGFRSAW